MLKLIKQVNKLAKHKRKRLLKTSPKQQIPDCNSKFHDNVVAMDCEFVECVGVGNALARCSVLDYHHNVLADFHVKPPSKVINYNYRYSGITSSQLNSPKALPYTAARYTMFQVLKDKLIIGQALSNDMRVLKINADSRLLIDVGMLPQIKHQMTKKGFSRKKKNHYGLKLLTKELLKTIIQKDSHCSIEDSHSALELFKLVEKQWHLDNSDFLTEFLDQLNVQ